MLHRGGRGKGGKGGGAPPPPAGPGHTKVYVGNLSWETSWQDFKDHFRQVGEVLHADIMTGADGRSKGCGLVTFASPHDAARAISTLHDSVLHSRSIFVREDREAALPGLPAPGGGRGGGKGGGDSSLPVGSLPPPSPQRNGGQQAFGGAGMPVGAEPGAKVFVGNLSFETSWQDLKDHFRQAGEVLHADIMTGADGRSKGCGMVTFSSSREAAHAIQTLNQTVVGGRNIFVREDREAALPGLPAPSSRAPGSPAHAAAGGPPGTPGGAPGSPQQGGPPSHAFGGGLPPARSPARAQMPSAGVASPGGAGPAGGLRGVAQGVASPGGAGGAGGAGAGPGNKVYVGNLAWETSWQDLKDHFRQVGEVLHADIMLGADGRSKGCGLVSFANAHEYACLKPCLKPALSPP